MIALAVLRCSLAQAQPFIYDGRIGPEDGPPLFSLAADVTVDSHGHVIVVDANLSQYFICDYDGDCSSFGSLGDQLGQFSQPTAVDVNSDDDIFIAELGNSRVQKCDHAGNCEEFEVSGISEGISPVWPWGLAVDKQNRVLIADTSNSRIIACPKTGGDCDEFGEIGQEVGQFSSPQGIDVDNGNHILITDTGNGRVQVCERNGNCKVVGLTGEGTWHFQGPWQIAALASGTFAVVENAQWVQVCTERAVCRHFAQSNFINPDPSHPNSPQGITEDAEGRILMADANVVRIYRHNLTINPAMSVGTFNSATPGQGVLWDVFQELGIVFGAMFTFELQRPAQDDAVLGESAHRWLTMQLAIDGNAATGDVYLTRGGVFDSADPAVDPAVKVGTATLEWHDCSSAWLTYDLTDPPASGMIELRRLTADAVPLCVVLSGDS